MAKTTPKHRAMKKLEALGWTAGDVERCIRRGPMTRRFDLFSLFDIVAIRDGCTLGLQVTSSGNGNVSAHVNKMLDEQRLREVLKNGWMVELWGVRSKAIRDGSFAVVRSFRFTHKGRRVAAFDESLVL